MHVILQLNCPAKELVSIYMKHFSNPYLLVGNQKKGIFVCPIDGI